MFTAFTHDSEAGAVQLPYEHPYKNAYQRQSGQYLVSRLQKASNKKKTCSLKTIKTVAIIINNKRMG